MAFLRPFRKISALVGCTLLLGGCGGGGGGGGDGFQIADAPDEANDEVAITNGQAELEIRMIYPDANLPVDDGPAVGLGPTTPLAQKPGGAVTQKTTRVKLRLVAELFPPTVAGQVVQATSISLDGGDKAMVSYNMRGAPRLGAIDWITNLTGKRPVISSSARFWRADVSAVVTDGSYVYAAAATDLPGLSFPAVFHRIAIDNDKFRIRGYRRVGLSSFAGTSVARTSDEIYATSGNTGEVVAFGKSDLEQRGAFPLHDARWVAWDKDGKRVVVVQGTPGQVSIFEEGAFPGGSMNLINTFPFPGADVPESKSTADIAGGKAFIAAGPEGVQVMCLDNGEIVGSVPRPDPAALGLDPAVVVTNAVAVYEDLMFISNGEAGVYVAAGDEQFKDSPCDEPLNIDLVGRLRFDDLQSANHVEFENDYLFVAAGLGGVKVVRIKSN